MLRTVNTADAEEIEVRLFGVPNAVVRVNRVKAEQDQNEKPQHDVNEENVSESKNNNRTTMIRNTDLLSILASFMAVRSMQII